MEILIAVLIMLHNLWFGNRFGIAVVPNHDTTVQALQTRRHIKVATFEMAIGKVGAAG